MSMYLSGTTSVELQFQDVGVMLNIQYPGIQGPVALNFDSIMRHSAFKEFCGPSNSEGVTSTIAKLCCFPDLFATFEHAHSGKGGETGRVWGSICKQWCRVGKAG